MNIHDFIGKIQWQDLPESVRHQARRCLLDTIGCAIGGRKTELSRVIHEFAAAMYGGDGAILWLDGRKTSQPGAALANGMTIDALDMHDGFKLVKGHAGAAIVPAGLATLSLVESGPVSGKELLTTMVVGYEVGLRAGLALHNSVEDYHSSGAWSAIGCAAITARRLGLDQQMMRHALGIAEYHGPRSQMMRCIDHPTMVKDGSGWGSMAGVSAGLLAYGGFTGAPALTVEAPSVAAHWSDLGHNWLILSQYYKPYAVCYWAQPAIQAALILQRDHEISPEEVQQIRVYTFHQAARLTCRRPQTTEQAQYSLPYPIAAALVYGKLGPLEVSGDSLKNPEVLHISDRIRIIEEAAFSELFPGKRVARVQLELHNGKVVDSLEVESPWDESNPPTDDDLRYKFRWLSETYLPEQRARYLEQMIWDCEKLADVSSLVNALAEPVN